MKKEGGKNVSYKSKRILITGVVVMLALAAMTITTFAAEEAEYQSAVYATFWSLVPPIVAIVLALITKEVYSSLFIGIITGGLLYANFNPVLAINSIVDMLI